MSDAYQALARAVERLGYPVEFAQVMAGELRSDRAMARMTAYLTGAHPGSPEEIADELVAICSERDRWVERKQAEWANDSYYRMQRAGISSDGPGQGRDGSLDDYYASGDAGRAPSEDEGPDIEGPFGRPSEE